MHRAGSSAVRHCQHHCLQPRVFRTMASAAAGTSKFEILSEKQLHQRYLTLYDRTVRFPASQDQPEALHEFDVVGHPQSAFQFAVTFPFHPAGKGRKGGQVTVLREYCSGVNDMMWVLPTGGFSPHRHQDCLECAKAEMSEEAHLEGGEWHSLMPAGHPGIAEVKWCANRFTPFLCVGPQEAVSPGVRDAEEVIEVHRLEVQELRQLLGSGDMLLPSVCTCFLALERLTAESLI